MPQHGDAGTAQPREIDGPVGVIVPLAGQGPFDEIGDPPAAGAVETRRDHAVRAKRVVTLSRTGLRPRGSRRQRPGCRSPPCRSRPEWPASRRTSAGNRPRPAAGSCRAPPRRPHHAVPYTRPAPTGSDSRNPCRSAASVSGVPASARSCPTRRPARPARDRAPRRRRRRRAAGPPRWRARIAPRPRRSSHGPGTLRRRPRHHPGRGGIAQRREIGSGPGREIAGVGLAHAALSVGASEGRPEATLRRRAAR